MAGNIFLVLVSISTAIASEVKSPHSLFYVVSYGDCCSVFVSLFFCLSLSVCVLCSRRSGVAYHWRPRDCLKV